MKKIILITMILVVACSICIAQEKVYVDNVSTEDEINDKLPRNLIYRFEQFVDGTVIKKDGNVIPAKLNYNTLVEEMQFISDGDKILALGKPEDVEYIIIDKKIFMHTSGKKFAEIVATGNVELLTNRHTKSDAVEVKNGAYGTSSTTSTTKSYTSAVFNTASSKSAAESSGTSNGVSAASTVDVDPNGNPWSDMNPKPLPTELVRDHSSPTLTEGNMGLNYVKNISEIKSAKFTILDEFMLKKDGKYTKILNSKSFLKLYPQFKNEITQYISSNNIDFNKEKDLIKLTNFCNQLSLVKK
ncbi:MAG: hypothetical protein LBT27_09170 [Prevotellaceae bacterium]|jgi:hypothetical protein|nr:hypothetical protein [Prevotellaceae bacterium]